MDKEMNKNNDLIEYENKRNVFSPSSQILGCKFDDLIITRHSHRNVNKYVFNMDKNYNKPKQLKPIIHLNKNMI